ncbi:MAG: hypothetical protein KME12_06145 [Trichocoleus desertorum ATA4-8-CV12]|nr:hypothetical protein [Trichocoleus desertorum ATA4-8-CV12]
MQGNSRTEWSSDKPAEVQQMYDYELLQRYLEGQRDFHAVNLSRLNLAGASSQSESSQLKRS